ncbi:hypothetical protein MN116_006277 [Schistosoma mekongi]|uniref:Uncharacterized protein n=1 Tax=Schistosoma mekongi TaxID=38744 RepID=A0AAE2D441_SCHME|nr:hypothetical protein MN116_006277 [Schistosoma mekongi]
MYSVIYRMNKLANFIGKERDEYKLKASICAGITHKNNHFLQDISSENYSHSSRLSLNESRIFFSLMVDDVKSNTVISYDNFSEKYSGVVGFLAHINSHNFQFTLKCTELRELYAIYGHLLVAIHKRLLNVQHCTYNLVKFKRLRGKIGDLLFAENKEEYTSNCFSDSEEFLQQYVCLDNVNLSLCELLTQWKDYMNVLVCLLDDFYSSSGFATANIMIIHFQRLSNITKSKVSLSQLYMQKGLSPAGSKTIQLQELRIINETLKIWLNISKHFKKIQSILSNQLNSTNLNAQSEPSASDNSGDPSDEQFQSSKTIVGGIFDLSFFDSFLFYDQLNEYTWDTRRHSCGSLHCHKPKSALKKSSDASTIQDKMSITNETETILCEPVYIMNKSLMKCLIQSMLHTLQDYTNHLQFGCDPMVINIMNSSKMYLTQCENNLNIEYYNCLNILLQTPVFATSVHGQLFSSSDIGLSNFWCHKNQNILDEQFNTGFTTQNMLCLWNGAVGTGAGLPLPKIYISKSLQTFIAFNLEVLLPVILNLLQVDISDQESKSQLNNLYSEDNSQKPADSLNETQSSDNLNDENLHLLVFEVINILVTILNGHGLNKSSSDDGADNSTSTEISRSNHDTTEFIGLTAQLSAITLSVDWDLNGIERLALCISDCLSLRALCSLLATIFQNENEFSVKSNKFNGKDNVTSLFLRCVKEYDVSIRLLSEQITDICLVCYYKIGFTIEEDLNYFNEWKLLLLPYQFKLQLNQSTSKSQSDIEHLSKPIQSIWFILSNIWSILIQTCPGGLTRQIMAHVSSKILESAIQQLHVNKMNPSLDHSMQIRDELWFILGIAKFALYRSAETISEVLGIGNLTVELNTIHTTALLVTQMLLSYYAPRDLWEKLHEEGFYSQMTKCDNKTFDFSLSNWLTAADPTLFHDIPIHLIKEHPRQTELEIEIELFSASAHFDPVRIISILASWNYKLSLLILESVYVNRSVDILTIKEEPTANQLFTSLLRILDAIPEYADFLGKVVDLAIIPRLENCKLFCQTLLNYEEWPIWFNALIQLMAEPLERIWIRFKELKDQRLEEDESFHGDKLLDQLNENPKDVFIKYTPKRRAYWDALFPSGQMPCGCLLPEPFSFNHIKHSHICTSNTTDVNRDSSSRSTSSSMKQQLKITSKLDLEEEIGNYSNYYQKCGCSQEAWFELANDIIRLPVINCSPGLQLALTKINDNFMIKTEKESAEYLDNNNSHSFYGQHFAIHLVVVYLSYRIHEEIKTKLHNNEYESQQKPAIEQLQYSILLEYLQSLVNINEENEEIYACKNRVKSFLSDRNDEGNDTESFIPGNSSKIFKNIQNLRFVQEKGKSIITNENCVILINFYFLALPDLFFMHEFLHANTNWIRELIRSQRDCYKNISIKTDPCFQLDDAFNSNTNITLIDSIEEINWEKIYRINVGLQEL